MRTKTNSVDASLCNIIFIFFYLSTQCTAIYPTNHDHAESFLFSKTYIYFKDCIGCLSVFSIQRVLVCHFQMISWSYFSIYIYIYIHVNTVVDQGPRMHRTTQHSIEIRTTMYMHLFCKITLECTLCKMTIIIKSIVK
jgi:hypothetical protein